MYPPPITSNLLGIAGNSRAVVEFRTLLLSRLSDGIVAITEPVAIIAFSKFSSSVPPSILSILSFDELTKLALP